MTSLPAGYAIRPLSRSDAAALTDAMVRNREHLAPWSPRRSEAFFTLAGQQDELAQHLRSMDAGQLASYLIVREERIAGRINVQNIIRGAFHSAALGYWVDGDELNKGLASAAVAFACDRARELGLHRLEAGTLVHN
ncbi:MAG TPA: GNAT family N-acetyltransferase, partial [Nocardioidaceae bacterium]|nr:GNAT family N-acetyltransferase [Nocardioidaceae bacterium]